MNDGLRFTGRKCGQLILPIELVVALVLKLHAREPAQERLAQQPGGLEGGLLGAETAGADIRYAVALAVLATDTRLPGEVGAETVGRGEAGTLADQHQNRAGAEKLAGVVSKSDARLSGEQHWRQAPAMLSNERHQS